LKKLGDEPVKQLVARKHDFLASVVVPAFNAAGNLPHFYYERLLSTIEND
jgi:hypothetical protein